MTEEGAKTAEAHHEISPEVGRFIEVFEIVGKLAQQKFGTSLDGLREQGEASNDFSKISQVVEEANRIVGPEDEFVSDYLVWQETKQAGSHQMNFQDWRKARNEAYRIELEKLEH